MGAFDREALIACAAALMAAGIYIGHRLHANLNPVQFRRFVALILPRAGYRCCVAETAAVRLGAPAVRS